MISLRDKKVLVVGLGLLGGGVATTKWLVKQGAKVTVTDLKTRKELAGSIRALGPVAKKIRFVLGRHDEEDFRTHDFVVVNPGVPKESKYLKIAKKAGARLINDAVLFFEFLPKENPIIAVTGTRGKTTTTNWIAHFLRAKWPYAQAAGNTPENPLLKELERIDNATPVVVELSSWQLEYLPEARRAPDIAVITNLYPDHMNRYASMKEYARAKANIFKNQTAKQILILNKDNEWTKWFLAQKPISHIRYTSSSEISEGVQGEHNIQNLQAAGLAAHCMGISWKDIQARVSSLPTAQFRQEVVYEKNGLCIVNDSASTSPEAGIAALERFSEVAVSRKQPLFFIAGGTDKGLSYEGFAKKLLRVKPNLFLLEGSATQKIFKYLNMTIFKDITIFKDLETIIQTIRGQKGIVVFSPAAASFEKFRNEFDRGEKFNALVRKYFRI